MAATVSAGYGYAVWVWEMGSASVSALDTAQAGMGFYAYGGMPWSGRAPGPCAS